MGLSILTACAVGPDYKAPAAPTISGYATPGQIPERTVDSTVAGGASQHFANGQDLPAQWWALFRSSALNAMVQRSLLRSPTLDAAAASLRQARELVVAQQASYFPTVQLGASPTRQRNAVGTLAPSLNSGNAVYSRYTGQLAISYLPDVFGLNRRQVESLAAQADSQRFQWEAARVTLASNVVAAAIQEASLRGQIAAIERVADIQAQQTEIAKVQHKLGAIPYADVIAQQASLAQTKAIIPPLKKQLAIQRDLLSALSGEFPGAALEEAFQLSDFTLPVELPVSLPAKLVEQRPDVRAHGRV